MLAVGRLRGLWDNDDDGSFLRFNHFVNSGPEKGFFQL